MDKKLHSLSGQEDLRVMNPPSRSEKDVLLICSTREEALIPYYILSESLILKRIIDTQVFKEARRNAIFLPISYNSLKRIVEYLWYKYNYRANNGMVDDFKIEDSETLDLLEVSSFLRL